MEDEGIYNWRYLFENPLEAEPFLEKVGFYVRGNVIRPRSPSKEYPLEEFTYLIEDEDRGHRELTFPLGVAQFAINEKGVEIVPINGYDEYIRRAHKLIHNGFRDFETDPSRFMERGVKE